MIPDLPELPSTFTLDDLAVVLGIVMAAAIAYLLGRWILTAIGMRVARRMNPELAKLLTQQHVFSKLALLFPALVVLFASEVLQQRLSWAYDIVHQLLGFYVIIVCALVLFALLNAFEALLVARRDPSVAASLQTLFRWLRIGNIAVAVILALSVLANIPVTWALSTLGVLLAAGSIVFGDAIYNAVSRIILKGRGLVAVGDWLEVPALQINGRVTAFDAQLIVVQNWDNTLAIVSPRYLMTNTFRNWQQMIRLGTRRIFRYLYVDVTTVQLVDDQLLAAVQALPGVAAFLEQRAAEAQPAQPTLTNVALYRAYLMHYLTAHPKVSQEHTRRVTNEDSVGHGLPLLLVAYLTETQDIPYRMLDAEIYEHALAVAPRFGLRVYQAPAGSDVRELRTENREQRTEHHGDY